MGDHGLPVNNCSAASLRQNSIANGYCAVSDVQQQLLRLFRFQGGKMRVLEAYACSQYCRVCNAVKKLAVEKKIAFQFHSHSFKHLATDLSANCGNLRDNDEEHYTTKISKVYAPRKNIKQQRQRQQQKSFSLIKVTQKPKTKSKRLVMLKRNSCRTCEPAHDVSHIYFFIPWGCVPERCTN